MCLTPCVLRGWVWWGQVWMMVTSSFLWVGVGSALNTLCSQAYGARNYPLVGIWFQVRLVGSIAKPGLARTHAWRCHDMMLQVASLFSTVLIIPVMVAWWFTGPLLRACGFSAVESDLAATFARWSILGLWPNAMCTRVRWLCAFRTDLHLSVCLLVRCGCGALSRLTRSPVFVSAARCAAGLVGRRRVCCGERGVEPAVHPRGVRLAWARFHRQPHRHRIHSRPAAHHDLSLRRT